MPKIGYGQTIEWRGRDGSVMRVRCTGYDNHHDAFLDAYESATRAGDTPRRWWEWRRWGEPDYLRQYLEAKARQVSAMHVHHD